MDGVKQRGHAFKERHDDDPWNKSDNQSEHGQTEVEDSCAYHRESR